MFFHKYPPDFIIALIGIIIISVSMWSYDIENNIKIMLISSISDYIYKIIIKQILKKSIICPIFSILIWKDMYN